MDAIVIISYSFTHSLCLPSTVDTLAHSCQHDADEQYHLTVSCLKLHTVALIK